MKIEVKNGLLNTLIEYALIKKLMFHYKLYIKS